MPTTGKKGWTPEKKQKLQEQRARKRAAKLALLSPEERAKAIARYEVKAELMRQKWQDPEFRAKMIAAARNLDQTSKSKEWRERQSRYHTEFYKNPAEREKQRQRTYKHMAEHPEIYQRTAQKLKEWFAAHPEKAQERNRRLGEGGKKWAREHPEEAAKRLAKAVAVKTAKQSTGAFLSQDFYYDYIKKNYPDVFSQIEPGMAPSYYKEILEFCHPECIPALERAWKAYLAKDNL